MRISERSYAKDMIVNDNITLPDNYDFLKEFEFCDFGPLRQECGCCYAYAAIKSFSHRYCRKTGNKTLFSVQYIVSCDICDDSCSGGCEKSVYYFLEKNGVTKDECHPWVYKLNYDSDFCGRCISENVDFELFKSEYDSSFRYVGVEAIKRAIYFDGPVSASIYSTPELRMHKSGVFSNPYPIQEKSGNHAVEIIGWGKENNEEYWIVLNNYGENWGDKGRIKIRMGSNENLIESFVYGTQPKVK